MNTSRPQAQRIELPQLSAADTVPDEAAFEFAPIRGPAAEAEEDTGLPSDSTPTPQLNDLLATDWENAAESEAVRAKGHQLADAGSRRAAGDAGDLRAHRNGGTGPRPEGGQDEECCGDPGTPHRRNVAGGSAGDYPLLRSRRTSSATPATAPAMPKATSSA